MQYFASCRKVRKRFLPSSDAPIRLKKIYVRIIRYILILFECEWRNNLRKIVCFFIKRSSIFGHLWENASDGFQFISWWRYLRTFYWHRRQSSATWVTASFLFAIVHHHFETNTETRWNFLYNLWTFSNKIECIKLTLSLSTVWLCHCFRQDMLSHFLFAAISLHRDWNPFAWNRTI